MSNDYLLSIDNGTQSVRALLFDLKGSLVAKSQVMLPALASPQPGWAECEPEAFWEAVTIACQRLWATTHAPKEAVRGVAITTQRGTVVNLDKQGRPLRPAISWLDQRKAQVVPPIGKLWRAGFKLAGVDATIRYFQHEAEINWMAQNQPEVWEKTAHFLLLSGYLNYRMTGRIVDSTGSQVGYVPFDFKRHAWSGARDWKWQALAIRADQLPELVAPGTVIGEVTSEAATATGIPIGTPVIAAAADKACEVIGAGCLEPQVGCLSYGTTATINTTSSRYIEATPFIPPYPAAVPGMYSTEVQIFRGFWMVSWFKEQFGHLEQMAAQTRGVSAESLFDELVNTVPPGSMGLMLQPYWTPGIRFPGPEAKGAIIGFGDVHTRAHVYRAILEGLAYALREGREKIEKKSGVPINVLRISGGGSQSDAAMQLTANIFNLPTARPHVYETSGLGAAIDAAVGLGLHGDFKTAIGEMTRMGALFEPDPQAVRIYDDLYHRVYKRMYERMAPLYQEIREITGYPKLD